MSQNRPQNLPMKTHSDGIDYIGQFPRSKSNSMIDPVAKFQKDRNLSGDNIFKYIWRYYWNHWKYIIFTYCISKWFDFFCLYVFFFFFMCFVFVGFFCPYLYKEFQESFSTTFLFMSLKVGNMLINIAFKKTKK